MKLTQAKQVEANGIVMAVDERGAGEPVVLLHGGMTPNVTWSQQIDVLGTRYHVVAPERRGHGRTPDSPGPLSYAQMTEDMASLVTVMSLGPCHFVGWSDGGILALLLALHHPELVTSVACMGSNSASSGYVPGVIEALVSSTGEDDPVGGYRAMYEAASPDGPDHFDVVWQKVIGLWSEPFDFTATLPQLTIPVLLMVADHDVVSLEHTLVMLSNLSQGQLAVFPGSTHNAPVERAEWFNWILGDFLAQQRMDSVAELGQ